MVRIREMKESCVSSVRRSPACPRGRCFTKVPRKFKPPVGDAYIRVESARGDMAGNCVSDGSEYPYRVKIRTGSFTRRASSTSVSRGLMIADLIASSRASNLVAPEIDR